MADDALQFGDEVRIAGERERRQPFTFMHFTHTGRMKFRDRYGYPKYVDSAGGES